MSVAARAVLAALAARGWTIATAESLTGGLVSGAITEVPGASACHRGGVVAYATDLKRDLLGVAATLLDERGAVDPDVALAMARGARAALAADVAVATTGVAGPDPQDGKPVGTVYVAVCTPLSEHVEALELSGSRERIRRDTVTRALELAARRIGAD